MAPLAASSIEAGVAGEIFHPSACGLAQQAVPHSALLSAPSIAGVTASGVEEVIEVDTTAAGTGPEAEGAAEAATISMTTPTGHPACAMTMRATIMAEIMTEEEGSEATAAMTGGATGEEEVVVAGSSSSNISPATETAAGATIPEEVGYELLSSVTVARHKVFCRFLRQSCPAHGWQSSITVLECWWPLLNHWKPLRHSMDPALV